MASKQSKSPTRKAARKPASRRTGTQGREGLAHAAFKAALDNLSGNVMIVDPDLMITYLNPALRAMLAAAQTDIRRDLPQFDVHSLAGASVLSLDTGDSVRCSALAASRTHASAQWVLGGRTFLITANPAVDSSGKHRGTVIEWVDRTTDLSVECEFQEIVDAVNRGDLTKRIPLSDKKGFHDRLACGINQLADNMGDLVGRVKQTTDQVARSAEEISQGNADLSQRTEEQAASLEETASSMEEMTSTVKQNADNAGQASQLAQAARDQAEKGGVVVAKAVKAMTEINEASKKIADIIGVIDEIAFQTNLLALNAAVEAARAGEQGRGFAVVASEVRNLAGRSATAAKEIKELIQDSTKKVEEGSQLVVNSGQTLEQLVSAVKKVSDIIGEIAAASQEQSCGIEQVNKAVMQLDEMTQQNSTLVQGATLASESMAGQARALTDMLDKYSVSQESRAATDQTLDTRASQTGPVIAERRGASRPWSSVSAPRVSGSAQTVRGQGNRIQPLAAATGSELEWTQF